MTNVVKINNVNMDRVQIIDSLDELRDRLHLLDHATSGIIGSGIQPSDSTVAGIGHAFQDCCMVVDRISEAVREG